MTPKKTRAEQIAYRRLRPVVERQAAFLARSRPPRKPRWLSVLRHLALTSMFRRNMRWNIDRRRVRALHKKREQLREWRAEHSRGPEARKRYADSGKRREADIRALERKAFSQGLDPQAAVAAHLERCAIVANRRKRGACPELDDRRRMPLHEPGTVFEAPTDVEGLRYRAAWSCFQHNRAWRKSSPIQTQSTPSALCLRRVTEL